MYFPFDQGLLSGVPAAIGWEEGSNPNCLLYLANQGSRWIAGWELRCPVVSDTCVFLALRFLALAPVDSFPAGAVPRCHLSPATEPPLGGPAWPSVTLHRDVQQTSEDSGQASLDFLKVSPF